jgi:Winged helix DNA-binding domain
MRRTVFLVPTKNAARIFNAVRSSEAHALRPLKRAGISEKEFERYARRVLKAEEPLTTRDLERTVGLKGSELGVVLRCLRYEGRVLTLAGDSLNMSPHRYIGTSSWIPDGLGFDDVDEARAWLAREYLRAFGPARVEDFAWWTGLPKGAAGRAVAALDTVDVGDGYLLPVPDQPAFSKVKPVRNAVKLLPRWDAYTMGYAPDGRERSVHPDVQADVYNPIGTGLPGDGNPVILVDGEVAGLWTFSQKEGPEVLPFDSFGPRTRRQVDQKLDEVAGLLA